MFCSMIHFKNNKHQKIDQFRAIEKLSKNYLNVKGYLKVAERLFEMLIKHLANQNKDYLKKVPKR